MNLTQKYTANVLKSNDTYKVLTKEKVRELNARPTIITRKFNPNLERVPLR